jgi:hypothetical protein
MARCGCLCVARTQHARRLGAGWFTSARLRLTPTPPACSPRRASDCADFELKHVRERVCLEFEHPRDTYRLPIQARRGWRSYGGGVKAAQAVLPVFFTTDIAVAIRPPMSARLAGNISVLPCFATLPNASI